MKYNILVAYFIVSSLLLTGCFSNKSEKNSNPDELVLLWHYAYDLDGGAPRIKPVVYDSMIISSGDLNVTSLNFATGEQIWKTPFSSHRQLTNRSFGLHDNILTGSLVNRILAWNIKTGENLWEIEIPNHLTFNDWRGVLTTSTGFIAPSDRNHVYHVSFDGELNMADTGARSFEATTDNSAIYLNQIHSGYGRVTKMNSSLTEIAWTFDLPGYGSPSYMIPIVENNIVYFGTVYGPTGSQNGFFALDAHTGQEIWRQEGINTYSADMSDDRIFGVNGQRVWALDKHTGDLLWITRGQGGHSESNLVYYEGYVYWAHGGGLHIFDAKTGQLLHVEPPPNGSFFWLVIAGKGRIFAQSNRHLYAFAPWGHTKPLE